jgi:hypothetical protein
VFSVLDQGCPRARQDNPEFGELAGVGVDLNRPAMLLDDDVVTNGQAQPSPFTGGLCRKERIEHLLLHLGWNAGAVVANPDFDAVTQVLGRGSHGGLVAASIRFRLTLRGCVEPVRDQIEQRPRNLLREQIDLASRRVKGPFQGDREALLLGPCPVIGEIEALIDQGVDIDRPVLSRPLTRMQQHVLDDRVGALAVLHR